MNHQFRHLQSQLSHLQRMLLNVLQSYTPRLVKANVSGPSHTNTVEKLDMPLHLYICSIMLISSGCYLFLTKILYGAQLLIFNA